MRVTGEGARIAEVGLQPADLVLSRIGHDLAVVDLLEELSANNQGSSIVTEREVRVRRRREITAGTRQFGRGRIPDGELILGDRTVIAVELEMTSKRTENVEQIVDAYAQESYAFVWWFTTSSRVTERYADIVRRRRADDFMRVETWAPPPRG